MLSRAQVYAFRQLFGSPVRVFVTPSAGSDYRDVKCRIEQAFGVSLEQAEMGPWGTFAEADVGEVTLHVAHVSSLRRFSLRRNRDLNAVVVMVIVPRDLGEDSEAVIAKIRELYGDESAVVRCGWRLVAYKWAVFGNPVL